MGCGMSSIYGVRWLTSSHICMAARYLGHYSRNSPCLPCCHPSLKSGVSWMKPSQPSLVIMAWAGEEQTITLTKSKKTLWRHNLLNMWHKTSLRYMFPNSPCNKKSLFPFDILELTPVYWLEREWLLDFATQFCNPFESDLWEDEWLTPYRVNIYQHKQ